MKSARRVRRSANDNEAHGKRIESSRQLVRAIEREIETKEAALPPKARAQSSGGLVGGVWELTFPIELRKAKARGVLKDRFHWEAECSPELAARLERLDPRTGNPWAPNVPEELRASIKAAARKEPT